MSLANFFGESLSGDSGLIDKRLIELAENYRVYPFIPKFEVPATDKFELFNKWLKCFDYPINDLSEPLIPVGTVGPLMILGHHFCPGQDEERILNFGISQKIAPRVVVPEKYYRKTLASLMEYLDSQEENSNRDSVEFSANQKIDLTSKLDALKYLCECLVFDEDVRLKIEHVIEQAPNESELNSLLPNGYGEALEYLTSGCGILDVRELKVDEGELSDYPESLHTTYRAFPYLETGSAYFIVTQDVHDMEFESQFQSRMHKSKAVHLVLANSDQIEKCYRTVRTQNSVVQVRDASVVDGANSIDMKAEISLDSGTIKNINPNGLNVTPDLLFRWVLHTAVISRASDVHIEHMNGGGRYRLRIDKRCQEIPYFPPEDFHNAVVTVCKNYANMSENNHVLEDGRFSLKIDGQAIDVRVGAAPFRDIGRQTLVLRLLNKGSNFKRLTQLDMEPEDLDLMTEMINRQQGMIFVTGPTGSGKSTSLYGALAEINTTAKNIHTAEDPVEYELEGLNQTQVDENRGVTYSKILKSFLRLDPDVIFVGEVRDLESAEIACNAALTGHLVFSTMHTLDSLGVVQRLDNLGVAPYVISDSLMLSQAQRLVRRLCERCRREYDTPAEIAREFEKCELEVPKKISRPVGCEECGNQGYRGMTAVMEFCRMDQEFSEAISRAAKPEELRRLFVKKGYRTLYDNGMRKIARGVTSYDEVKFACVR